MKVPKPTQQPSGKWFIRLRLDGVAYSRTFDTEREAIVWATSVKAQHVAGQLKTKKPAETKTVRRLMSEYIDAMPLAPATVQTYTSTMEHHFVQFMDRPYNEINNWQKCVNIELRDSHPNTVGNMWAHVRAALRWHGLDVPDVKIPRKPSKQKEYLTAEEIPRFCEAVRGHKYEAYFLMMLESMRVSEAVNVEDADITDAGIHVRGTKTDASDRFIPWLIPRLKEVIYDRPPVGRKALWRAVQDVCEENGLPALTPHGLRVSFASLCYSRGVPERVCMKIGGWASLKVMHDVYVRISDDDVAKYADLLADTFH